MTLTSWSQIVQDEQSYLSAVGEKLKELDAQASQNMAIEEIYSAVWQAYNVGISELHSLKNDLDAIDNAVQSGQLSTSQYDILRNAGVPQDRWLAALQVLACMRCLRLPSAAFKNELSKQAGFIIGKFQSLLRDNSIAGDDLAHDLNVMAMILCSFISLNEVSAVVAKKELEEPIWKGFLTPQAIALAVASGLGAYAWLKWKDKKEKEVPELAAAEIIETEPEDEDEDEDENEVIIDVMEDEE